MSAMQQNYDKILSALFMRPYATSKQKAYEITTKIKRL